MFKEDLELGKEAEFFICSILKGSQWPKAHLNEGESLHAYDIATKDFTAEVKYDVSSEKTGNVFFELSYKGNPSGIMNSESDIWFEVLPGEGVYIQQTARLREIVESKKSTCRVIDSCGDNGDSSGVIVPIIELKRMMYYVCPYKTRPHGRHTWVHVMNCLSS